MSLATIVFTLSKNQQHLGALLTLTYLFYSKGPTCFPVCVLTRMATSTTLEVMMKTTMTFLWLVA